MTLLLHPIFLYALAAGFAASITSGIVGSLVVVRRIVFISGSIAHSVLGGMGFFLYLKQTYHLTWLSPLYGALFAAILSALLIGWIHLFFREREDTVIAALWSTGMAIGVIFISLTPGYNVELMNFLFGNILWVSKTDLILLLSLDALTIILAILFHQKFLAITFDEEQAKLQGLAVKRLYFLLLSLVAISVVLLIQVVGAILVIAMLALPAAVAGFFTSRLSTMMFFAIGFGALFCVLGMAAAFLLNWPVGASICLTAALFYILLISRKRAR